MILHHSEPLLHHEVTQTITKTHTPNMCIDAVYMYLIIYIPTLIKPLILRTNSCKFPPLQSRHASHFCHPGLRLTIRELVDHGHCDSWTISQFTYRFSFSIMCLAGKSPRNWKALDWCLYIVSISCTYIALYLHNDTPNILHVWLFA